jgi:Putative peptidoglycan binding domain/CHAP domain
MLARERAVRIALAEAREGVRETGSNTSKRIRQYQSADSFVKGTKDTGYAWCASFVVWCYREAGRVLTETGRSASVPDTAKAARSEGWVRRKPRRGDVVCLQLPIGGLPPVDQTPDHIGLVVEVNSDGSVRTVEGNTPGGNGGEGVFVVTRPRSQCETIIRVPGQVPAGLGRGDHGRDVEKLQRQLVRAGHRRLAVDGEFGDKTEKVVRTFQRRHGVPETGVATAETQAAIKRVLQPQGPAVPGRGMAQPRFDVQATFPGGGSEEAEDLRTRAAMNEKVNAFLDDGARSVRVSPSS